jgi:putative ABC transport system permease protein
VKSRPTRFAIYRKKSGAVLIAVQIAVTLAILTNAMTLIVERLSWSAQPTGIDEANIFCLFATSVDPPPSLSALESEDLALLRSMAGVANAYATNSYPLQGGGWSMDVALTKDQKTPSAHASYYFGDEQALSTLGVKLIAGRNFTASEIIDWDASTIPAAGGILITRALAQRLFPAGDALGKSIYIETQQPAPIIGIIDRLQGPFVAATGFMSTFTDNSVLAPFRPLDETPIYVVRTKPGKLNEVIKAAQSKLAEFNGSRIISARSMGEVRARAYRSNRGLALLLGAVTVVLVAVTAFGMVGLTSYWVAQRRRQIGIRRALGATRLAIMRQFQTENLLIASSGVLAGILLALSLNIWLVGRFEMVRLDASYVIGGAIVMLLLGQIAVYWPARRAAQVPPALAVRGSQIS